MLAVGGLRDEAVLRELTTGNLAHDGQRIDGSAPLSEIARRLTLACRSGIQVAVDGRGLGLARDPRRRPARRRGAGLRRPAGGPAAAPHPGGRPVALGELGVRRAAPARTGLGPGPHRAAAAPARRRLTRGDDDLRRALGLADHRAERPAPGAEPVHRPAGARNRIRLRALRPRPARPRRHPDRRPGRAGRARPPAARPVPGTTAWRQAEPGSRRSRSFESLGDVGGERWPRSGRGSRTESKAVSKVGSSAASTAVWPAGWPAAWWRRHRAGIRVDAVPAPPPPPPPRRPPGRRPVEAPAGRAGERRRRQPVRDPEQPRSARASPRSQREAGRALHRPLRRGEGAPGRRPDRAGPRPRRVLDRRGAGRRAGPAGAGRGLGGRRGDRRGGAGLRLAHRPLPEPRRPAAAGRRAPRAAGRARGSSWRSTPTGRPSWTGRTIPRATGSSPGPCCAPAASRRPSRRSKRGSSSSIRAGVSPASTGCCGRTSACSRRPGCAPSRPGARRCSTASRPTAPGSRTSRRCASCSPGRPTPTTSTSTSRTARAATPTTGRRRCPRAASCTPTSPPATAPSASRSARRPEGAAPYRLQAHYYRRGPMGYGMGTVQVVRTTARAGSRSSRGRSW